MSRNKTYDRLLKEMAEIHEKKEIDYSLPDDPHSNFKFAHNFARPFWSEIDAPYAYLIGVKFARLATILNSEQVMNEPIEDTFKDIANYVLLWASRRCDVR